MALRWQDIFFKEVLDQIEISAGNQDADSVISYILSVLLCRNARTSPRNPGWVHKPMFLAGSERSSPELIARRGDTPNSE
jgi:hypothetical protein